MAIFEIDDVWQSEYARIKDLFDFVEIVENISNHAFSLMKLNALKEEHYYFLIFL